ncbi:hypothetical protein [Streptomyces sp. NPDC002082]|uniref:hypothetical protein n=1 Tax=Streptomyces sp. NPDC002082 TaxID=3154772 RepID=UPI0033339E7A
MWRSHRRSGIDRRHGFWSSPCRLRRTPGLTRRVRLGGRQVLRPWPERGRQEGLLSQASGFGKTTLVLTVEKDVAATYATEVGIEVKASLAGMGWGVTNTYTVRNGKRYEVPAGRWGTVQAYPLCDPYQGDVCNLWGPDTGKDAYAYKPVGVCFNSWNQ